MFGFDPFGIKRRRLAREAALEAQRKRLLDRVAPIPALQQRALAATRSSSSPSSPPILAAHDPLHSLNPLNPLSPLSVYNQIEGYAAPGYEREPGRSHCSPSVSSSDDSWSRSSSCSGSDYGSSSSSSYDSGSSSSSSDSSSY